MENKPIDKQIVKYLLLAAGLVLAVIYFAQVAGVMLNIWGILTPLVIGFVIAYVLNILMRLIERVYFPRTKNKLLQKSRRAVSLIGAIIIVMLVLFLIVIIVLPQIFQTFASIAALFPGFVDTFNQWIADNEEHFPVVADRIGEINIDWQSIVRKVADYATRGISGIFTSSVKVISVLTSGLFDAFVALAFAIYLLAGKERLIGQLVKLQKAFMKKEHAERLNYFLSVADESFTSFITGQFTEAIILGSLCALGMTLLGLPYAATVGVFVGATALIPVVGAYLGAGVGVFLILMVNPMQALLFLAFILILQQLENNLIYPRVVGTSIGLPGVWVLVAVVIGGGLSGVIGMLLGVPVTATVYKLLQAETRKRLSVNGKKRS